MSKEVEKYVNAVLSVLFFSVNLKQSPQSLLTKNPKSSDRSDISKHSIVIILRAFLLHGGFFFVCFFLKELIWLLSKLVP